MKTFGVTNLVMNFRTPPFMKGRSPLLPLQQDVEINHTHILELPASGGGVSIFIIFVPLQK